MATAPTLATVQLALETVLRELLGARLDIESLKAHVRAIRDRASEMEEIIRVTHLPGPGALFSLTPGPSSSTVPPGPMSEPRPSLPVRAAQSTFAGGKWLGKWGVLVSGGLALAGQFVALWKPEYAGPIIQALRLLASLGGGPGAGDSGDGLAP